MDPNKMPQVLSAQVTDWYNPNAKYSAGDYTQLGQLYRTMSDDDKQRLIRNVVTNMGSIQGPKKDMMVNLQLCHWFRADMSLGMAVANRLNINLQEMMKQMTF